MASWAGAIALPLALTGLQVPEPALDLEPAPAIRAANESHHLATLDNDNDGIQFILSARTDAQGRLLQLRHINAHNPADGRVFDVGPAMSRCTVSGAARLDRRRGCGVEMEHARGDTSAIRLFTPGLDPVNGGRVVIFYLRHYAIFGSHDVGVVELWIQRSGDTWGLYTNSAGAQRRVLGIFIHRLSRGVSLTACVDGACPADWPRRGRDRNDGLPPVWGARWLYAGAD
ncbi:MAG: hypothetical protein HY553_06230 [Elusimicrobia bacterium]|nr:hypothetical protein [Elusimicrobiota bacterium]